MYSLQVNFEEKEKQTKTLTDVQGDQSLLEVVHEAGIDLHHNCGGVCACSTCHIYMEEGEDFVEEISDKEEDFVDRARNPKLNSRLACQCVLQEAREGAIRITIPDQSIIQGEDH